MVIADYQHIDLNKPDTVEVKTFKQKRQSELEVYLSGSNMKLVEGKKPIAKYDYFSDWLDYGTPNGPYEDNEQRGILKEKDGKCCYPNLESIFMNGYESLKEELAKHRVSPSDIDNSKLVAKVYYNENGKKRTRRLGVNKQNYSTDERLSKKHFLNKDGEIRIDPNSPIEFIEYIINVDGKDYVIATATKDTRYEAPKIEPEPEPDFLFPEPRTGKRDIPNLGPVEKRIKKPKTPRKDLIFGLGKAYRDRINYSMFSKKSKLGADILFGLKNAKQPLKIAGIKGSVGISVSEKVLIVPEAGIGFDENKNRHLLAGLGVMVTDLNLPLIEGFKASLLGQCDSGPELSPASVGGGFTVYFK